jgi:O-methyltransferase
MKRKVMEDIRGLYLDLMKKCVTNWFYGPTEMKRLIASRLWKRKLIDIFNTASGLEIVIPAPMDPAKREKGMDWPPTAHTMIGIKRLNNLQFCIERVLAENIPGDLIECGVWRGGAVIFMRAILKAYDVPDRVVYVANSFQGCPKPDAKKYPMDSGDNTYKLPEISVPLEEVRVNFESYGLLDGQVRFLKGWFKDTLPGAPIKSLAVLRLDGDLYESTSDILNNLYPKLSRGGYCIIDDFFLKKCREAVLDYRKAHGVNDDIIDIDEQSVYWKKRNK